MKSELRPAGQGSAPNSDLVQRLKIAVRIGGGNKAVAAKSGIKLGTLNNYVREVHRVPADAAAKIAAACNVSVDWLLRGEGPMEYLRVGTVTPEGVVAIGESQPLQLDQPSQLQLLGDKIDLDRLGQALREADIFFAAAREKPSDRARIMAVVVFYNHLTEAQAAPERSAKMPENDSG